MTASPLKKFVFTPKLCSAAVFSALTLPLAVFGNKPVTIQLQDESIFHGELREAATPYLGLVTAISLGTGVGTVAVTGWRQSSRKSALTKEQLSQLEQNLKQKQELLETFKCSESHLELSGLSCFLAEELKEELAEALDPDTKSLVSEEVQPKSTLNSPATQPIKPPVVEPLIITTQPREAQPVTQNQVTVQATVMNFASAQNFFGYNQSKAAIKPSKTVISPTPLEVQELHHQLQEIMAQMSSLQTVLQTSQQLGKSQDQAAEHPNSIPLKVVKSWSLNPVAS
ncbi:MAG TPA: hypothetical protein DCL61_28570 [Cyanobacteria bacterium UBA12227]|nr:hypothetical protein [Cyanobacteria bacterium UBA12227]